MLLNWPYDPRLPPSFLGKYFSPFEILSISPSFPLNIMQTVLQCGGIYYYWSGRTLHPRRINCSSFFNYYPLPTTDCLAVGPLSKLNPADSHIILGKGKCPHNFLWDVDVLLHTIHERSTAIFPAQKAGRE